MAVEIVLPRLGWTMEEGTFVEWLMKDGDAVKPGDLIYVVESDKTTAEVENFDAGILRIPPDSPAPGARIPVGTLLAYVAQPGEVLPFERVTTAQAAPASVPASGAPPPASKPAASAVAPPADGKQPAISPRARRTARELGVDWSKLAGSGITGRIVERDVRAAAARSALAIKAVAIPAPARVNASPVAQRAAQELGIDLHALAASMPDRRIERADVERAAAEQTAVRAVTTPTARPPQAAAMPTTPSATRKPMSSTRRLIAERMATTMRTVAPVTLVTEADATELVRLRESLKTDAQNSGEDVPSYNDLLAKIAARRSRSIRT